MYLFTHMCLYSSNRSKWLSTRKSHLLYRVYLQKQLIFVYRLLSLVNLHHIKRKKVRTKVFNVVISNYLFFLSFHFECVFVHVCVCVWPKVFEKLKIRFEDKPTIKGRLEIERKTPNISFQNWESKTKCVYQLFHYSYEQLHTIV